jgi:ATP-dependent protease ClpP protease subunit
MLNTKNDVEIVKTKKQVVGATQPNNMLLGQIEFGMSIPRRLIYIEDTIDIYTGSFLEQRIYAILDSSKDTKSPITVKVSSYGGDVYGMFSTIDVINNAPVKINTLGAGPVMSAAAFILAAGTGKRYVTKNTIVMIHMMSSWFGGTTSDIVAEVKHIQDLQSRLYGLLEQHSKKPASFWSSNSKTNLYLPAEKCIEFGLADEVV